MNQDIEILYKDRPQEIDLREPVKPKVVKEGVVRMEMMGKTKIFFKSVQYSLILIGAAHVAFSGWAFVAPDATVYRNLKGMAATDRAYIKQILNGCGSSNFFEDKTDSCQISTSALATLFKGQAVVAHIEQDRLPDSKRSSWEAEAQAAEATSGNVQSPAKD